MIAYHLLFSDVWPFMLLDERPGIEPLEVRGRNLPPRLEQESTFTLEATARHCPEIDVCRLVESPKTCLVFLSGFQGSCDPYEAEGKSLPYCNESTEEERIYSCHKIPTDFRRSTTGKVRSLMQILVRQLFFGKIHN